MAQDSIPLCEPTPISDIFASELVRVERIGPCVRLIFAVPQILECGEHSQVERTVVARIVLPAETLQDVRALLASSASDLTQRACERQARAVN